MTSDVTLTGSAQQAQRTQQQSVGLADDFNQFLQLLTTQMQNQDPTSPMDPNQMTQQIVQFSQVEQQINMNQKLDSIVQMGLNNQASIATGYIGLNASYQGSEAFYDGSQPVDITYVFDGNPSQAKISIQDEEGNTVFTTDARTGAGRHAFQWDGTDNSGQPVAPGTYQVAIGGVDSNGEPVSSTTVVTGKVRGIEQQNGVPHLLIGNRAVPIDSVINASLPDEAVIADQQSDPGQEDA